MQAYKTLAKTMHPDRNPDDPLASDKFIAMKEMYAVLILPSFPIQAFTVLR